MVGMRRNVGKGWKECELELGRNVAGDVRNVGKEWEGMLARDGKE